MTDLSVTNYKPYNINHSSLRCPVFKGITEPTNNSNILQSSTTTDTVTLSANKSPMTKETKILLTLGGITTAILSTVLAIKGYRSHQITKGLEKVEQKFLKLQQDMPKVQQTFKDVFLRNDITEKEALEILNRYKEVEKIGVTGTKKEYIKAVYEEAKRNFGFTNDNFEFSFIEGQMSKNGKTIGGAGHNCTHIQITPSIKLEQIQDTIHHEMRHMKQRYYAINYDPQEYKKVLHMV